MPSGLEKYKLEEKLRRLYFKHRGDVLAVAREAGLEDHIDFVRKVTGKIKRGFKQDVSFEIACFVTDALLAGREQRLILMEDRLKELLNKKELRSVCCREEVVRNDFGGAIHYKCKKCSGDCEVNLEDLVDDPSVVRYIDRMRKEDELIYKFLVTMGFISKVGEQTPSPAPQNIIEGEVKVLSDEDSQMLSQLQRMDGTKVSELRRLVEKEIKAATEGSTDAE